ncbi:MAG: hypothetical protein KatS3mg077_0597 [Candidatus Binatia bacterium]|nr:MAG: hypothetical protein KatS3mg077_0597 [Candidatus Binatia bacterium]
MVAVSANGEANPVVAARTALGAPIPVIGVRPGHPPRAGTLLWNQPRTGHIHITLARGRQSFTFHTTAWEESPHYVIALFLDGEPYPRLVLETGAPGATELPLVRPLGLDGDLLPARPQTRTTRTESFEVSVEEAEFPDPELRLDLVGPWALRPDNIADLYGTVVLTVRELPG